MTFAEFYQISWFANMSYVQWDQLSLVDKNAMIVKANAAARVSGDPDSPETEPTLGQEKNK
tara:strand:+ start:919 stop:1101 length:183 start_codon:yes stop_codon:yes gene_type:complete